MDQAQRLAIEEIVRRLEQQPTETGTAPAEEQARALAVRETRSSRVAMPDDAILQRQRSQMTREGEERPAVEVPLWLRALVEKKASDEEVIGALEKRLRRAPTKENLLLAKALVHDLAKKPGNGQRLREMITQELVSEIIRKGA